MTIAVCIYCGEKKFGAWMPCESCGRMPRGMEDLSRSMILSDHYMTVENLEKAQRAVKDQYPWYEIPHVKARIDKYKRECFTEDGEFDEAKIMAHYGNPSHSDDNAQDNGDDDDDGEIPSGTTGACVLPPDRKAMDAPHSTKIDKLRHLHSHAPTAICIFCGEDKDEPLAMCPECRRQPKDLDSVSKSFIMSDHNISPDLLIKMQDTVRQGFDWTKVSAVHELLRKYRSLLADENGELDLMKVARYCNTREPRSPSDVKSPPKSKQTQSSIPSSKPIGQPAPEDKDEKPWNRWVNFVFDVLSIYFPLGMLIGSIGMVTRKNREQCVAVWDSSTRASWWLALIVGTSGIYYTDLLQYYVATFIASFILMKLIRYFGQKPKPQQYISVVLSTIFFLLPSGLILAFYTGAFDNPERDEVISYCTNSLPPAAAHEQNALNRWASLVQQDAPLDDCAPVIEREILPELKKSQEILESAHPQLPALRELHGKLLDISRKRIDAFNELDAGIREHNEVKIQLSNTMIQSIMVNEWVSGFQELLNKYDVNASFPNLDGATPAKP